MATPKKLELFDERNPDYHYFRVKKEDIFKMLTYEKFIHAQLAKGNKIPHRIFKKYLSFYSMPDEEKIEFYSLQVEQYKKDIITRFKEDDTYYFSLFEDMIEETINDLIREIFDNSKIRTDKLLFLHLAYNSMNKYLNENLKEKERKKYKDSRIKTIAGYIAYVFGYQITYTAATDSNKQIFNAVKYSFKRK